MFIFFDENFPPSIAAALDKLEDYDRRNHIHSTSQYFGQGIADPKLIKNISNKNGVWVTFDRKALKAHIKILKRYKVPVFAFDYGSQGYWDKVHLTLKHWKKIKELIAENKKKPFYAFRVTKTKIVSKI